MRRQPALKVLIIESQLIIAADISVQLLKLGYDVVGIGTPYGDTMKAIRRCQPDLVMMNIKMYGMDRKISKARTIIDELGVPVIFISAHTNEKVLKQVLAVRPYAFIPKPFTAIDLQRGLNTAFKRLNSERTCMPMDLMDHESVKFPSSIYGL